MKDGLRILARDLFASSGRIGRVEYVVLVLFLLAFQAMADAALAAGAGWSIQGYVAGSCFLPAGMALLSNGGPNAIPVALPFLWALFNVTSKRLRDAEWPEPLAFLAFIPGVGLVATSLLAVFPGLQGWSRERRCGALRLGPLRSFIPESGVGAFALALIVGMLMFYLAIWFGRLFPWAAELILFSCSLMAGIAASLICGYHVSRMAVDCCAIGFGVGTILTVAATLVVPIPEAAMSLPLAVPSAMYGSFLGYGLQLRPPAKKEPPTARRAALPWEF